MTPSKAQQGSAEAEATQHSASIPPAQPFVFDAAMDILFPAKRNPAPQQQG